MIYSLTSLPLSRWQDGAAQKLMESKEQQIPQGAEESSFTLSGGQVLSFERMGLYPLEAAGSQLIHGVNLITKENIIFYPLHDDPMKRENEI